MTASCEVESGGLDRSSKVQLQFGRFEEERSRGSIAKKGSVVERRHLGRLVGGVNVNWREGEEVFKDAMVFLEDCAGKEGGGGVGGEVGREEG